MPKPGGKGGKRFEINIPKEPQEKTVYTNAADCQSERRGIAENATITEAS
jgi:hypothetical protein